MCPGCKEPLVAFELEGIEIDHCVECKGTWLDAGELQMFLELAGQEPGHLTQSLHEARRGSKCDRRCPRCEQSLRVVHFGGGDAEDGDTVELDECPRGHGLWFDHGEILTFVRKFDTIDDTQDGESSPGEEGLVAHFFARLFRHELEAERAS